MSLVELSLASSRAPLFLVHGMGGTVLGYRDLAARLADRWSCFGIEARGIDDREAPLDCVEAMAAAYIDEIRRRGAPPEWRLVGWSFGGVLAFEMSIQLSRAGMPVRAALLDSRGLAEPTTRTCPSREAVEASFAAYLAASNVSLPDGLAKESLRATYAAHLTALARYRPGHTRAPLLVIRATDGAGVDDDGLGFAALAQGRLDAIAVPASHAGLLLSPHVEGVAQALDRFFSCGDGA